MNFADLEESEDAILRFAKNVGLLGVEYRNVILPDSGAASTPGESFDYWVREIRNLRGARDIAFAIEAEDHDTIRDQLRTRSLAGGR